MKTEMKLGMIPNDSYSDYRYRVIFGAYKWDPQVEDHNTVSQHVVLLSAQTAKEIGNLAEQLAAETVQMEQTIVKNRPLIKALGLPNPIYKAFRHVSGYEQTRNVRLMRFDFHPTTDGWKISEVNSDVPGGLAEASLLPKMAAEYFPDYTPGQDTGEFLYRAIRKKTGKPDARVAFVHATSYSDDRQVMQFLGDHFDQQGFDSMYAAPDHIRWQNKKPLSIVEGQEGPLDALVRFYPLEWLAGLPRKIGWQAFFDCDTVCCNHPVAMLTQTKRLPLVWDRLGLALPAWKMLLPETKDPKHVKATESGWILKPALGRVGEGISIQEAVSPKELRLIRKMARRRPVQWVAQRRFESRPLMAEDGTPYHLCLGVFTIDGKCAGFYGRISPHPRIDAKARDIPVLVKREVSTDE